MGPILAKYGDDLEFLGKHIDDEIALKISKSEIDP